MKRILFTSALFGMIWLAWPKLTPMHFAPPTSPVVATPILKPTPAPTLSHVTAMDREPHQLQQTEARPTDESKHAEKLAPTDVDVQAQLEALDRLRKIPGAAPMIDEIVRYLSSAAGEDDVSLDNIPTGDAGLAEVDDHAVEEMVRDKHVRETWEKLMALVAQHPEVAQDAPDSASENSGDERSRE